MIYLTVLDNDVAEIHIGEIDIFQHGRYFEYPLTLGSKPHHDHHVTVTATLEDPSIGRMIGGGKVVLKYNNWNRTSGTNYIALMTYFSDETNIVVHHTVTTNAPEYEGITLESITLNPE